MSLYDYMKSKEIAAKDYPFYAILMAAMRQADSINTAKLKGVWPEVWKELQDRYNAPHGILYTEEPKEGTNHEP